MKKKKQAKQSVVEMMVAIKHEMSELDFMFIENLSKFKVKKLISVFNERSEGNELYLLENGIWLCEMKDVPNLSHDEIIYLSAQILSTAKSLGGFDKLIKYIEEFQNLSKAS